MSNQTLKLFLQLVFAFKLYYFYSDDIDIQLTLSEFQK